MKNVQVLCGGRRAGGFTLVEVCVAIAIVAIGILTAMSILLPALKWAYKANNQLTVGAAVETAVSTLNAGYKARCTGSTTPCKAFVDVEPYRVFFQVEPPEFSGDGVLIEDTHCTVGIPPDVVVQLITGKLAEDIKVTVMRIKYDADGGNTHTTIGDPEFETTVNLYRIN